MGQVGDQTHKLVSRQIPTLLVKIPLVSDEPYVLMAHRWDNVLVAFFPLQDAEGGPYPYNFDLMQEDIKIGRKCFTGSGQDMTCDLVGYSAYVGGNNAGSYAYVVNTQQAILVSDTTDDANMDDGYISDVSLTAALPLPVAASRGFRIEKTNLDSLDVAATGVSPAMWLFGETTAYTLSAKLEDAVSSTLNVVACNSYVIGTGNTVSGPTYSTAVPNIGSDSDMISTYLPVADQVVARSMIS
jgi:hypothetical protein